MPYGECVTSPSRDHSPSVPPSRLTRSRRVVDRLHQLASKVYITDDGPGLPIEDWEAVFQPYVRVDRVRSRGSGIGLFAARRLMEAMGGRVWIERNGFGGSRFVVALPIA
jgi:signal transduction histidine kinase